MKNRFFMGAILLVLLTAGLATTASAQCYDRRPHHRGYYAPRVRVCAPVRVYAPPIVAGPGCYGPRYCPPPPPPRYAYRNHPRHYSYYR